ncbi:MAG: OmpA family protein [Bacteroidota bacterium]
MKNLLFLFAFLLIQSLGFSQQTFRSFVYFKTDEANISEETSRMVQEVVDLWRNSEEASLLLIGHTDNVGSLKYNLALSQKRVEAIRDLFLQLGMPNDLMALRFLGETAPTTTNEDEQNRQQNRRVEMVLTYQEKVPVLTVEEPVDTSLDITQVVVEEAPEENIQDFLAQFAPAPQLFHISPLRDTSIQGAAGTILFFKANSLKLPPNPDSLVVIQLTEYYTAAEIILNNLTTTAKNRPLETAGMIKVEAWNKEQSIPLKRGQRLEVFFPNANTSKDFQLFKPAHTEANEAVSWRRMTNARTNPCNAAGMVNNSCAYRNFIGRWFCNWRQARAFRKNWKNRTRNIQARNATSTKAVDYDQLIATIKDEGNPCRTFLSPNLALINCDRFLNEYPQNQLVDVLLQEKAQPSKLTAIVFHRIKSVMQGSPYARDQYFFQNLPPGHRVTLVSIKYQDEKVYLAQKACKVKEVPDQRLVYQQVDKAELLAQLKSIGW